MVPLATQLTLVGAMFHFPLASLCSPSGADLGPLPVHVLVQFRCSHKCSIEVLTLNQQEVQHLVHLKDARTTANVWDPCSPYLAPLSELWHTPTLNLMVTSQGTLWSPSRLGNGWTWDFWVSGMTQSWIPCRVEEVRIWGQGFNVFEQV